MTFPALLNLNEFVYDATKSEPPKKMSWASAVSVPRFSFLCFITYMIESFIYVQYYNNEIFELSLNFLSCLIIIGKKMNRQHQSQIYMITVTVSQKSRELMNSLAEIFNYLLFSTL